MKTFISLLFLGLLAVGEASGADVRVAINSGTVVGESKKGIATFKGIPYGAPPVGELRWKPPVSPQSWAEPLETKEFASECPQIRPTDPLRRPVGNEDCLTLNVWSGEGFKKQPVMVFIHGGGNSIGSSEGLLGAKLYDGTQLVKMGDVVVVTINYRLGALGFLSHPQLAEESAHKSSGNYALLDQMLALKWVKQNISAFGGDAQNITVFGESAGAINILALISSPLAKGLFKKAIVQSGFLTELSKQEAEQEGESFAKKMNCETLKCLREKEMSEILKNTDMGYGKLRPYSAVVDGFVLKEGVLKTMQSGTMNDVSLIIGSNADEMTTLLPALIDVGWIVTDAQYNTLLKGHLGEELGELAAKMYPPSEYSSRNQAFLVLSSDAFVHCPNRQVARAMGDQTWRYIFTHKSDNLALKKVGAGHGMELPFVFHLTPVLSFREELLSEQMVGYWTSFAHEGDPNRKDLTPWLGFKDGNYQDLNLDLSSGKGYRDHYCDFWDQHPVKPPKVQ